MNAGHAQAVNLGAVPPVEAPRSRVSASREQLRLDALDHYDVMDSAPEEAFDSITRLSRQVLGVPMATISFLDGHREWFKSRDGVADPQIARERSLGDVVVSEDAALVVLDAQEDDLYRDHPSVAAAPYARFYAGVPLRTGSGLPIGVLAAMDTGPRDFGPAETRLLADLGRMAMTVLELRLRMTADPVTGVMSRGAFRAETERAFMIARRHRQELGCLMVGLDHLPAIAGRYGAACGEEMLKRAAHALQATLRASDIVGRVGPSAFAVLLPVTGKVGARDAAGRVREAIARVGIETGGSRIAAQASLGLASFEAGMRLSSELLEEAEAGLFHARQHGGNRVVAWPRKATPGAQMRRRVCQAGSIEPGHTMPIACTVRSLSGFHATLEVIDGAAVPESFTLHLPLDARRLACQVRARDARQVEVDVV